MRYRKNNIRFDTEKSRYLCHTPQGDLYRKRGRSREFFTWKFGEPAPVPVSWAEANELVRRYGTRDLHNELFTVVYADSRAQKEGYTQIRLDAKHKIKAMRNADRLGLSITAYIKRLIDRDDANNNYAK